MKLVRETLATLRALDAAAKCNIDGVLFTPEERPAAYAWGVRRYLEAERLAKRRLLSRGGDR